MARLKRLAVQVIAPVPAIDTTVQAIVLVVAILVGGTALGREVSFAGGIALIAGALFLLTARVAWSLQGRLEAIEEAAPKVEFAGPWFKREFATGGTAEGEWADFVGIYARNEGGEVARNVWVELEFSVPGNTRPLILQGRWSHNQLASLGEPFEAPRFTEIDLPPNARPEPFDVAIRFERDGAVYAMNTRALFSGGRHEPFRLDSPEFVVRARLRGEGIDLEGEWRCTDNFKLIPVSGDEQ